MTTSNMTQYRKESIWLWIHRGILLVMALLLPITGWALTRIVTHIDRMDDDIRDLQMHRAETQGSRFTTTHWSEAKAIIEERQIMTDRRITRLEEAVPHIKESLIRIETGIRDMKNP
jgi:hypothetical protein